MKIGILTFHRAINYGAVLQCYALSEMLKSLGHEVSVVDYRPEYIEYYRRKFPLYKIKHSSGIVNKIKSAIFSLLNMRSVTLANVKFDSFLKDHFQFSKVINSPEEVPNEYDVIFFGSDQIWSPQICFGFDPIYWGQFSHEKTRLITYAASLGGHNQISDSEWDTICEYLQSFERISVRELQLQKDLKNRLKIESTLVVDPTILVNEIVFYSIAERPKEAPENYVLVFSVAPTENLYGFAEKVASPTNSEIVVLSANKLHGCKYRNVNPSVSEFLGWFKYAKSIVTVSFHGTVFSVIFRKDFYSLTNYMQDRAEQFLGSIGLGGRLIDPANAENLQINSVDYSGIDDKLLQFRQSSLGFLDDALS